MEYSVLEWLLLGLFGVCLWRLSAYIERKKDHGPDIIRSWQFVFSVKRLAEKYPGLDRYDAAVEEAAEGIKKEIVRELEYTDELPLHTIRVRWEPCKKRRDSRE